MMAFFLARTALNAPSYSSSNAKQPRVMTLRREQLVNAIELILLQYELLVPVLIATGVHELRAAESMKQRVLRGLVGEAQAKGWKLTVLEPPDAVRLHPKRNDDGLSTAVGVCDRRCVVRCVLAAVVAHLLEVRGDPDRHRRRGP